VFTVERGAEEVKNYLGMAKDTAWPKYLFSDSVSVLGYSSQFDAINLPMRYLNMIAANTQALQFKDQMTFYIQDKFFVILKYVYWVQLFGRESTVHHYQKIGNPKLQTQFPSNYTSSLSLNALFMSNIEVEARKIVDELTVARGLKPVWKDVDEYFAQKFPEYYNKPLETLAALPKPDMPIEYEMESIWTTTSS
jgi:hypothetical protein